MSRARVAAIALAAAVMGLTGEASAGPPEVVAPAAASATPLVLAPGKPLDVAREPTPSGLGWKLLAAAVVVAAGAEFARRRLRPAAGVDAPPLRVVRRVSIGLRSELVVVEVEGQRLLLGVTAAGIQPLTTLDPEPEAAPRRPTSVDERLRALQDAAERRPATERRTVASARPTVPSPRRPTLASDEASVPGQARGLLRLGRQ